MADTNEKIPEAAVAGAAETMSNVGTPVTTVPKEQLLAQGSKFLEVEEIKHAPLEKKREFLLSKGLSSEDIDLILKDKPGDSNNNNNNNNNVLSKTPELKEIKPISPAPVPTPASTQSAPSAPSAPAVQETLPPIVTYPEFLAPPPAPPAPVNGQKLVSGLYLAAGVATTIYGASKYVFQPMYDSLTAARLELSTAAITNLTTFNSKLSTLVPNHRPSTSHNRPPTSQSLHKSRRRSRSRSRRRRRGSSTSEADPPSSDYEDDHLLEEDDDDDTASQVSFTSSSSSSSDPTELFHVDAGTQTTPMGSTIFLEEGDDANATPETKLEKITEHLASLVDVNSDGADNELTFELESLTTYLDSLTFDGPFGAGSGGGFYNFGMGKESKDDPVAKVKAEIRSVKGVFLNTKNFPAGR